MKNYFRGRNFLGNSLGLSEKGAKDLINGTIWATMVNLSLMALSWILYSFVMDSLHVSLNGETPTFNILNYILYALIILVFIIVSQYFAYNTSYMSAYDESANKRITLAETLRKLPFSFFGKKDLRKNLTKDIEKRNIV